MAAVLSPYKERGSRLVFRPDFIRILELEAVKGVLDWRAVEIDAWWMERQGGAVVEADQDEVKTERRMSAIMRRTKGSWRWIPKTPAQYLTRVQQSLEAEGRCDIDTSVREDCGRRQLPAKRFAFFRKWWAVGMHGHSEDLGGNATETWLKSWIDECG
ncbi:hypothetical protein NDU88_007222 [Pleurodeles waltl]|uniref:Uncharacterized protein n=1 Tax=Pleurodeles waltl TaxID=8319 RepID=A0AAV7RR43_PLEWA|nr:hypothetical protein NDU88_007222 [Pleurodeles waltl]